MGEFALALAIVSGLIAVGTWWALSGRVAKLEEHQLVVDILEKIVGVPPGRGKPLVPEETQVRIVDTLEPIKRPDASRGQPVCASHPRYRGKGKPRSQCEGCWFVYRSKHGGE